MATLIIASTNVIGWPVGVRSRKWRESLSNVISRKAFSGWPSSK